MALVTFTDNYWEFLKDGPISVYLYEPQAYHC